MTVVRTIHTITTESEDKEKYYEEDESLVDAQERYYAEAELFSDVDRLALAVWGRTQALEKREGYIEREDFKSVFKGTLPGSTQRIRGDKPNASNKERLAYDMVLSAPKSVSMALHLEGDLRVFDAQMDAAQETLEMVEKEFTCARIQVNGERQVVKTGNLIAALLPHHTSRDGDMQLHVHTLIMNGTKCPDGEWRSLWKEPLVNAEWIGSFYRQKLAEKMQGLGYRIYNTEHGFELQGYSQEDLKAFSKRNQKIVQAVEAEGLPVNAQNKKDKVLTTRKAKSKGGKSLEEQQAEWEEEAISRQTGQLERSHPIEIKPSFEAASEDVNSAIRHLSERSVSFSRHDIYAYAFKHVRAGGRDLEPINQAIDEHKSLIGVGNERFTTVEALERELEIVKQWMAGQGKASPMLANPDLEGTILNSGQAEAVRRTITSTDTHQIIHGLSGVGKTRALGELKRQLEGTGIEVRGFSPTIDAAAELQKELGIITNTVEHLVLSKPEQKSNQLWIIDEAGMVSTRQMQALARKAELVGARILLVGDKGQHSSVEAGSPFRSLIDHGATTHSIRQIIRQQNSIQKQAVELIASGNGTAALEHLNNNGYVKELESRSERTSAITEQYLALSQKERNKTLLVTGTNAERLSITKAIRTGLKAEGKLGESVKAVQLVSRHLTDEQAKQTQNYQVGDYLRLHRDYHSTSLQQGQLYKVERVDNEQLLVSSYGGRLYRFDPSKYKDKEVFSDQEIELAVGDSLRWTATDKNQGRINGKQFTVAAFDGTAMTVTDHQGRTQEVSLLQPLAVDYSLVSTSYRAQGKTAKRVIVSATSDPTSSREPFYVKISRQTKELNVYTQDLEQLKGWVKRSNAQQNPLELIGEHYDNQRTARTNPEARRNRPKIKPDRSPESRTDRAEPNVPPSDLRTVEHYSLSRQGRTEPVHQPAHRAASESEAERNGRDAPQALTNDGNALWQDPRQQHGLPQNEQHHRELSTRDYQLQKGDIGERVTQIVQGVETTAAEARLKEVAARLSSLHEQQAYLERELAQNTAALAEAIRSSQEQRELEAGLAQLDQLLDQLQLPDVPDHAIAQLVELLDQIHELEALSKTKLKGVPELAEAIALERFETELAETLLGANTAVERLDKAFTQAIQSERLETLSSALSEWRLGQELAEAILTFDEDSDIQTLRGELERIGEALAQLQSLNILDPDLEQLVSVVDQWQAEHRKTETRQIAELAGQLQSLNEECLLDESGLAEKLTDLTGQIERFSTIRQHERFEGIDSLAEAITELGQEEALTNSNLETKLNELTLAFKQLETRFIPTPFQGMKELAQTVSGHKADSAIAAHLAQFEQITEQVEQMMVNHPHLQKLTQVGRSLQETAAITGGIGSEELQDLADSLCQRQQKAARMPKKIEAFWEPQYPSEPPRHLQPKHWEEFKQSASHPDLIALNAESISDHQVYERLLSEKFTNPKYGAGQYVTVPIARELKKYEQMAQGGWWGNAGIDAQSLKNIKDGEKPLESLWGCYKPDSPRIDQQKSQSKGKTEYRKYENPASTKRVPFLPQVSNELAERIYQKHNVTPTEKERQSGFWYVVKQHPEIPITITEGFKKTLSSLSQGEVTIGLTGVNHIYRSKDDLGNKLPQRQLNEEVAVFAQPNREFRFAYDQDTKPTTICNVRRDMVRGIELLEAKGSTVKIVKWNSESGKGLDDLIANQGPLAYSSAQQKAITSELDKRTHYRTEYNKLVQKVNQEMGSISVERLDLEVYIRASLKGDLADGARAVGESDEVRFLREQHPDLAQHYIGAIASVAGTYGRMSQKDVRNLDELARQLVQRQTVALALEAEKALMPENAYTQKHRFGPRR